MYDLFFISKDPQHPEFVKLKDRFPMAKVVKTVADAKKRSLTRFYWVVWEDIIVLDTFNFEYVADLEKMDKVFAFLNSNGSYGIKLIPKKLAITDAMFDDVNHVDIIASSVKTQPLDIVFISNGEPTADEHYAELEQYTGRLPNRLLRVTGVNGRAAAYKEAARIANTHCFFAVFAKIKINPKFDWGWGCSTHEDRHYVFNVLNPVNGLVYGHQAIIAYNKRLVLANPANELDFTLAQSYQSIPMLSGMAVFNTSPTLTWRTAFREALKLKLYISQGDPLAEDRLNVWLSPSEAPYGEWSQKGALDAMEYFDEAAGDYSKLMLSYEWDWLNSYFNRKHSLTDSTIRST
jgi:hypothetical protein